jgi:hypothetical protein
VGSLSPKNQRVARRSSALAGVSRLAALLASVAGYAAGKPALPGQPPLSPQERAAVELAKNELRESLPMYDALRGGVALRSDVTRAMLSTKGKELLLAGGRGNKLLLEADGKLTAVRGRQRTAASLQDLDEHDIFSGAMLRELLHSRITTLMQAGGTSSDPAGELFAWSNVSTTKPPTTEPAAPVMTSFRLDQLVPPTLGAKLAAKLPLRRSPAQAADAWDLRRLKEGGLWLWSERIQLAARYGWKRKALVLEFKHEVPTLIYEADRKSRPATRADAAAFGIRSQADLDVRVLYGLADTAQRRFVTDRTEIKSPLDDGLGSDALFMPDTRERIVAELTADPARRTQLRERILARVDEQRYLNGLADGSTLPEDFQLLGRLRDLAPMTPVTRHPIAGDPHVYAKRPHIRLATRGGESLVVSRWNEQGRYGLYLSSSPDPWNESGLIVNASVESPLRRFGITNEADLEAALGRAFLKYSSESWLALREPERASP